MNGCEWLPITVDGFLWAAKITFDGSVYVAEFNGISESGPTAEYARDTLQEKINAQEAPP